MNFRTNASKQKDESQKPSHLSRIIRKKSINYSIREKTCWRGSCVKRCYATDDAASRTGLWLQSGSGSRQWSSVRAVQSPSVHRYVVARWAPVNCWRWVGWGRTSLDELLKMTRPTRTVFLVPPDPTPSLFLPTDLKAQPAQLCQSTNVCMLLIL